MDLCEMIGCTMTELDERVDAFEHAAWLNRWHECRFGSRWNAYYLAQIAGHCAHAFVGGQWYVDEYIVSSKDSGRKELNEQQQESLAFEVMNIFGGNDKAKKWIGVKNANN